MKKRLGLDNVQKKFRKIIFNFLTAIKFNSFQLKSKNTLKCVPDWNAGKLIMHR